VTLSSRRPAARTPALTGDEPQSEAAPSGGKNAVTLGPRDRLVGQLYIEGDLRLGGLVEGEVEATGDVDIDDEARVTASVAGGHVSIRGQVNGAVIARKRLVVGRTGSLIGDVKVARLVVQDGGTFSGNVQMGAQTEAPTRPAPPPPPPVEPVAAPVAAAAPPAAVAVIQPAPAPVVKVASPLPVDGKAKPAPPKVDARKAKAKVKPKRK
jgi:cytoskeletal protein CcmA (bactofilin family)